MSRFKDQSGEFVTGFRSHSIKGQRGQSGWVVRRLACGLTQKQAAYEKGQGPVSDQCGEFLVLNPEDLSSDPHRPPEAGCGDPYLQQQHWRKGPLIMTHSH